METYTILRDLSWQSTAGPFEASRRARANVPNEMRVDVARLDKRDVRDLVRDPQVQAIAEAMPTTLVQPVVSDDQPAAITSAWGLKAVGADTSTSTGAGVTVAVLDTGIDAEHEAFAGVTLEQEDFTRLGNGDRKGHGTHCAGTVFGRSVGGVPIGVAQGVNQALIGKVLDDDGRGKSPWMFSGIQWAVDKGADVISISIELDFPKFVTERVSQGWPVDLATGQALEAYRANLRMLDAIMLMIRNLSAFGSGTVVVAAAGNGSRRQVNPAFEVGVALPAAAEGIVSVAAMRQAPDGLRVANFSNTHAQISAPGVDILSAKTGGGLHVNSGTSMAAPHVAGIAALWWERIRSSPIPATAEAVVAKLLAHATTTGLADGLDPADYGVGLVKAP